MESSTILSHQVSTGLQNLMKDVGKSELWLRSDPRLVSDGNDREGSE